MATAKKIPVPVKPAEPEYTVELTLTKDEAEALFSILGKAVSSGPTSEVYGELMRVGVRASYRLSTWVNDSKKDLHMFYVGRART